MEQVVVAVVDVDEHDEDIDDESVSDMMNISVILGIRETFLCEIHEHGHQKIVIVLSGRHP